MVGGMKGGVYDALGEGGGMKRWWEELNEVCMTH